jgi:K+-sensing histidine kinase KdpD
MRLLWIRSTLSLCGFFGDTIARHTSCVVDTKKPGPILTPDERRLLDALIDQTALAIERVHLVEDMDKVKRTVETERLRSALLTSISHDLKTPLASVQGAAGTLRNLSKNLSDSEKADLLTTIVDESERLNRFIANLLDMTKLESGPLCLTPRRTICARLSAARCGALKKSSAGTASSLTQSRPSRRNQIGSWCPVLAS